MGSPANGNLHTHDYLSCRQARLPIYFALEITDQLL